MEEESATWRDGTKVHGFREAVTIRPMTGGWAANSGVGGWQRDWGSTSFKPDLEAPRSLTGPPRPDEESQVGVGWGHWQQSRPQRLQQSAWSEGNPQPRPDQKQAALVELSNAYRKDVQLTMGNQAEPSVLSLELARPPASSYVGRNVLGGNLQDCLQQHITPSMKNLVQNSEESRAADEVSRTRCMKHRDRAARAHAAE